MVVKVLMAARLAGEPEPQNLRARPVTLLCARWAQRWGWQGGLGR
eukprot:COSAG04_NODE_3020_length_3270_cov_2.515295_2_plen_45_part_00